MTRHEVGKILQQTIIVAILFGLVLGGSFMTGAVSADDPAPADPAVLVDIEMNKDGDAHWSIQYRYEVTTDEEEVAFVQLANAVRAGEVDLPLTANTMNAFLKAAEGVTERDMAITGDTWVDDVDDEVGVIALEFTWEGFAEPTGDQLIVGDAFRSADGTWLRSLGEGMQLSITGPDEHSLEAVPEDATHQGDTVTWEGPQTFEAGDIELRYTFPTEDRFDTGSIIGIFVVLLVLLLVTLAIAYRLDWIGDGSGESVVESESESAVDVELLSDPERVERLLDEHGGRMKQADIVEETGWSSAKVSQLLSEMAEVDRVQKLRIGQENLISLPTDEENDLD